MGRRCLGILLSLIMTSACGSTSTSTPSPASPTGAPTPAPAATQPSTQTTVPAASGPAAQFPAFRAHYLAQYAVIAALMDTLGKDAATNNAAAVQKDVADIHAWSQAEVDWMTANPPAQCYAMLQNEWDIGRTHADKAATVAGSGDWDSVEVNFSISTFVKIANLLASVHC